MCMYRFLATFSASLLMIFAVVVFLLSVKSYGMCACKQRLKLLLRLMSYTELS